MADKPYREALGSIMYAQVCTRPDLSFAVATLSRFASNPGIAHWKALQHVLRYISATLEYKVRYGGEGCSSPTPVGYVDADFAGNLDTRRSCTGYVMMQGGGPTSWGTKHQPTVALSTTEAEYMAYARAAQQIQWMYSAMSEVGYPQPRPAIIHADNTSAIALTRNTRNNARVKHIDIRHHFLRELVEAGELLLKYIPSTENIADLLTKPLGRIAHLAFCRSLRLTEELEESAPIDARESGGVL